ncbi:MAG: hypothetical protein COX77_03430 [Candidatus Komeilibacteria bacterium CG_4_10_14_0_2_um_filter_37_10]|uniref:Uncharacterized protein n=1 Tax=Candidatus Komeilibacteria bacterium CG_4_10_14_0_2_um_filter_37_10 TaxID=1974470 RepID=A0A2M7VE69_9BACT|nr:MAG: hypothetical protein COX77_03430 [Candidatus Komeilibacteria bacterium CG_4_10_14_0_2_um_filter_37_10]
MSEDLLCQSCHQAPVFIEGLCEFYYEDMLSQQFTKEERDDNFVMHSKGLIKNQEQVRDRGFSKVAKNKK